MLKALPGPGAAQPRPLVALSSAGLPTANAGIANEPTAMPSTARPMFIVSVSSRLNAGASGGRSCASESRCASRCAAHLCRARHAASAYSVTDAASRFFI